MGCVRGLGVGRWSVMVVGGAGGTKGVGNGGYKGMGDTFWASFSRSFPDDTAIVHFRTWEVVRTGVARACVGGWVGVCASTGPSGRPPGVRAEGGVSQQVKLRNSHIAESAHSFLRDWSCALRDCSRVARCGIGVGGAWVWVLPYLRYTTLFQALSPPKYQTAAVPSFLSHGFVAIK